MRKPRCDSTLKTLPDSQQTEIAELIVKEGYLAAVPEVKRLTGLRAGISVSSLHRFYAWYKVSHALEANRDDAQAFEELLKGNPELQLDAEKARLVGQLHFERRVLASEDPDLYFAWLKERRAEETLRLDREKLSLERDKFERLVMDKLDDLVAARSAAQAKGLEGDAMVAAVRSALWGSAAS